MQRASAGGCAPLAFPSINGLLPPLATPGFARQVSPMTHSLGVLSWAHPVCLLLQQPSTQSKSTSPLPGHTGQHLCPTPPSLAELRSPRRGFEGVARRGGSARAVFPFLLNKTTTPNRPDFQLPLMTRSEQSHAQPPAPPPSTQLPSPGRRLFRRGLGEPQGRVQSPPLHSPTLLYKLRIFWLRQVCLRL